MQPVSSSVKKMRRSGIREIMDLAQRMPDVVHLEVGEPGFPTPQHIVQAAQRAMEEGFTKYTPNAGLLSLREQVVVKLATVNGLEASVENVVVTTGAVGGLATALMAILEPGEEVLIPDPAWPNFEMMVTCSHGIARYYPLSQENGFWPQIELLEDVVTPACKAIIVNSPSNPTGAVFPAELVEALVDFAVRHDLYLVADEVYEQLVFGAEHVSPGIFDLDGRVVGVHSFSKTYAMTGWRVGYTVAAQSVSGYIAKLQEPFFSCASSVSQKAAEAALLGSQDCVAEMRKQYQEHRDLATRLLTDAGLAFVKPQGTFYTLVDISPFNTESYVFAKRLLQDAGVAVAPGRTFGPSGDGYVRVSLAPTAGEIREGLTRLASFVGKL
ncbi:MAG: pyridoxal phosphate-dependent aminotransferase [Anaerolineae bacterium]